MTAPNGQGRRSLYPDNEPFGFGWLPTGGPHEVFYEECGARAGKLIQAEFVAKYPGWTGLQNLPAGVAKAYADPS